MSEEQRRDFEWQIEQERQRALALEKENSELRERAAHLANQLANYKPMAEAWMHEHLPSMEECEREIVEILAHPESWVDLNDVIEELEKEFGESQE